MAADWRGERLVWTSARRLKRLGWGFERKIRLGLQVRSKPLYNARPLRAKLSSRARNSEMRRRKHLVFAGQGHVATASPPPVPKLFGTTAAGACCRVRNLRLAGRATGLPLFLGLTLWFDAMGRDVRRPTLPAGNRFGGSSGLTLSEKLSFLVSYAAPKRFKRGFGAPSRRACRSL
jgi:hypothetical protein